MHVWLCVWWLLCKPILALNCRFQIQHVKSDCAESDDHPLAFACVLYAFLSFIDSLWFKLCGSFVDAATHFCSILCSLFKELNWIIEILKNGFEGTFVAFRFAHSFSVLLHRYLKLTSIILYWLNPCLWFFIVLSLIYLFYLDDSLTS